MVSFRRITRQDVPLISEIRNLCVEYLHDSTQFSVEETFKWFDNSNPNFYSILLDNKMIGYFRTSNYSLKNQNIYIGADIHPNYWGKGIGFEVYSKFIPFLFNEYNLNKISLEVLSTNNRAISLYTKLGFKSEGVKREEIYKNNKFIDSVIMSILKKEFNL